MLRIKCLMLQANKRYKASEVALLAPKLFANVASNSLIPVLSVRMFQVRHSKLSLIFVPEELHVHATPVAAPCKVRPGTSATNENQQSESQCLLASQSKPPAGLGLP